VVIDELFSDLDLVRIRVIGAQHRWQRSGGRRGSGNRRIGLSGQKTVRSTGLGDAHNCPAVEGGDDRGGVADSHCGNCPADLVRPWAGHLSSLASNAPGRSGVNEVAIRKRGNVGPSEALSLN
jgi:hypothetical protein